MKIVYGHVIEPGVVLHGLPELLISSIIIGVKYGAQLMLYLFDRI